MYKAKNAISCHIDNPEEAQIEDWLAHLVRFHLRNVSRVENNGQCTKQTRLLKSGAASFLLSIIGQIRYLKSTKW